MNDFCEYCSSSIYHAIYTDTQRFCSDDCRINYHNQRRKILRRIESIDKAVSDLYAILEDDNAAGMHSGVASIILNTRFNIIDENKHGSLEYVCRDCELRSYDGKLICSCGGNLQFKRYINLKKE